MSKELEALNYLVSLAVVGNKENHRGKIFDSEEIIINAIKLNEPMKVKLKKHLRDINDGEPIGLCPNCNRFVKDIYKRCPDCGKTLDWSDEK